MRVSLPENIVGRRAVLHFRRCHALAGAAGRRLRDLQKSPLFRNRSGGRVRARKTIVCI